MRFDRPATSLACGRYQIARLGIARTFQIVQPFPKMTVLDNVAAGALFAGSADSSAGRPRRRPREHLAFTGLAGNADKPAATLTLAQRKRLKLAKGLAMKPKLLMLDEVNAGLNPSEIDDALAHDPQDRRARRHHHRDRASDEGGTLDLAARSWCCITAS